MRAALPLLALIALVGGALAALPMAIAWAIVPYLAAWLGIAQVDPTWNDGDGGIAVVAVAVVVAVLAGVTAVSWAVARGRVAHPGRAAAGGALLAALIALVPSMLVFAG